MGRIKVALIGAGSRSFGPATVGDLLLSHTLAGRGLELRLMDIAPAHLAEAETQARDAARRAGHEVEIAATPSLEEAVAGADFVVAAIEVDRYTYWAQDFHIAREHGFRQVYGENGGPGGLFHALRNMGPTVEIARAMERLCPGAPLLNYTNPEHKLCEAVSRLTAVQAVGLCHGVFMGRRQIAGILGMAEADLETAACGVNHFTWFTRIRDRHTGEDLYPRLRQAEREGDWLSQWHELGLSRVLLRRFGLWPSPGANHCGEYIRWAEEFVASQLQFYYDPMDGEPESRGLVPELIYSLARDPTARPWRRPEAAAPAAGAAARAPLRASGELAVPIMEALCGAGALAAPAVNVPNQGAMPDLPDDMVVEIPAAVDVAGLQRPRLDALPEAIAAMLRLQGSIQKLLVEAYAEASREKLLQALLLDPTVDSYRRAVTYMNEMLRRQAHILPPLR
ncbi:MAG: alpha-galactosidase [Gemmatimonadota bacterium]